MGQLSKLAEIAIKESYDCAVVRTGVDMAAILARASPCKARSFAVAMHERACASYDEIALTFWCDALEALTLSGPSFGTCSDAPVPAPEEGFDDRPGAANIPLAAVVLHAPASVVHVAAPNGVITPQIGSDPAVAVGDRTITGAITEYQATDFSH